jgi:uncharacterized protein YjbI with pentapeptide repeats
VVDPILPPQLDERVGLVVDDDLSVDDCRITGTLEGAGEHVELTACRLETVRGVAVDLSGARLVDVELRDCDLAGVVLHEAAFERVAFRDCRLSSALFVGARFRHVQFHNCKLDDASFRSAAGEGVEFRQCVLALADFSDARLPAGRLLECDLRGAQLGGADLSGSWLHGSALEGIEGATALRGTTVHPVQAMDLLPALCRALSITVDAEPELDGQG